MTTTIYFAIYGLFSHEKRCRNFATLTASTYHPIIKKTNPTSSWRPRRKTSKTLTLFNASLKKAADDNTVSFNPTGWCTDMVGANMNVLRKVFGEGALSRTKSCEFHFKESRNRMACKLGCTVGDVFKDLCQNVFKTNFEENYLAAKDALEKCID